MASSVQSLTDADFAELVAEVEVPVLVDFWAPWCGPCRQLAPVVESLHDEYGSALVVVKVNVDESPALTEKYNVSGVPTLMLFKGGEPVHQLQGARPKGAILARVRQVSLIGLIREVVCGVVSRSQIQLLQTFPLGRPGGCARDEGSRHGHHRRCDAGIVDPRKNHPRGDAAHVVLRHGHCGERGKQVSR